MHSHQVEDLKRTSNKYYSNDYLIIVVVASAVESNLGVICLLMYARRPLPGAHA